MYGIDVGLANKLEERVRGFRLAGVVNLAGERDGAQIGALNFIQSGPLPLFPLNLPMVRAIREDPTACGFWLDFQHVPEARIN